jgi:hypothetical protein
MIEANQPLRKDKTATATKGSADPQSAIESNLACVIQIAMQAAPIANIHCQKTLSQPVASTH